MKQPFNKNSHVWRNVNISIKENNIKDFNQMVTSGIKRTRLKI